MPIWLLLACGLLRAPALVASQDLPPEVAPDRPSLTNSMQTVPVGALQIELGLEYAPSSLADSPPERRLAMQATLRAGLTDRLEVRLDSEPLVWLRQAQDHTGLGDVALGMKYRFFDPPEGGWWPSLGIEPTANLPVGNMPIGSGRTDFGVRLLASQDLPWLLNLDINAGPVAVCQVQPHGYLLQALASGAVSRKVGEHQSPYAEVFLASREERDERETLGLDAGIIYFLSRRIALDAAMGTTLTGQGQTMCCGPGSVCCSVGDGRPWKPHDHAAPTKRRRAHRMAPDARQSKDSLTTKYFQYCQIIPLLEQAQLATN